MCGSDNSAQRKQRVCIRMRKNGEMKKIEQGSRTQESEEKEDRKIGCMLHVVQGDISDPAVLKQVPWSSDKHIRIDTIVNAAKPTLMGSDKGVDGAVHKRIDEFLKKKAVGNTVKTFNDMIREELDGIKEGQRDSKGTAGRIRCRRGQAVLTKGYGLCDYVIHVVGSIFDGEKNEEEKALKKRRRKFKTCSSSRVRTLESCYREIVRVIREHPDIKNVAVPIISSGTYGFPFEMAANIAIASIGNALLEWQQDDGEYFNNTSEGLQNIFFFICPKDEEKFNIVSGILAEYGRIFDDGNQVVAQHSFLSQQQYINEITMYDEKRGYFCIARTLRLWLTQLRLFSVYTYLKDILGGKNWQRRRMWVEITVAAKIGIAISIGIFFVYGDRAELETLSFWLKIFLYYNLADTVTYLISLILMADIQKPSANVIRSMLLLLLNYVEVSLEMACLYFIHYKERGMSSLEALEPGLLGGKPDIFDGKIIGDWLLYYGNTALKFFFITMAFGYFAGHLRQRTFRR